MHQETRPAGLGRSVSEELSTLNASIDKHLNALNLEGVWLFLASLSCWSIPDGIPRVLALLASLFLFSQQYKGHGHDQRLIPKQFEASAARISVLAIHDDLKQEGIEQVNRLKSHRMGGLRPFYCLPSFIVGWSAWSATLITTMINIWRGTV